MYHIRLSSSFTSARFSEGKGFASRQLRWLGGDQQREPNSQGEKVRVTAGTGGWVGGWRCGRRERGVDRDGVGEGGCASPWHGRAHLPLG